MSHCATKPWCPNTCRRLCTYPFSVTPIQRSLSIKRLISSTVSFSVREIASLFLFDDPSLSRSLVTPSVFWFTTDSLVYKRREMQTLAVVYDEESRSGALLVRLPRVYSSCSVYPSKSNPRAQSSSPPEHLGGTLQVAGAHTYHDGAFKRHPWCARTRTNTCIEIVYGDRRN